MARGICWRWIGAVLFAVSLAQAGWAADPARVTGTVESRHYRFALGIGPPETMHPREEADHLKPTEGEIVVSGHETLPSTDAPIPQMGGLAQSTQPAAVARHLDVHVTSKADGKPVTRAWVEIELTDLATGKRSRVSVVAMYGAVAGPSDWNYGNAVNLPPGHYRIDMAADGESASLEVTLPPL